MVAKKYWLNEVEIWRVARGMLPFCLAAESLSCGLLNVLLLKVVVIAANCNPCYFESCNLGLMPYYFLIDSNRNETNNAFLTTYRLSLYARI